MLLYQRRATTLNMLLMDLDAALTAARARRRLPPPSLRRALRKSAGVTQAAVAMALGVDRATVARWELGERMPSGRHLQAYATLLDRLDAEARRE